MTLMIRLFVAWVRSWFVATQPATITAPASDRGRLMRGILAIGLIVIGTSIALGTSEFVFGLLISWAGWAQVDILRSEE